MFTHSQLFVFSLSTDYLFLNLSLVSITAESKQLTDVTHYFSWHLWETGAAISALWTGSRGLSKLLKARQWEQAGAEVWSSVLAPAPQAVLYKWADRNPLLRMVPFAFKTLNLVRSPDIQGSRKKDLETNVFLHFEPCSFWKSQVSAQN